MFTGYTNRLYIYANAQGLPAYMYNKTPEEFFKLMSSIPYKEQTFEDISRKPIDIIRFGGDCGEKTKLCMSYFMQNRIPFNLIFQQAKKGIYHVFPQCKIDGQFTDFDTAYGVLQLGQRFLLDEVYKVTIQ